MRAVISTHTRTHAERRQNMCTFGPHTDEHTTWRHTHSVTPNTHTHTHAVRQHTHVQSGVSKAYVYIYIYIYNIYIMHIYTHVHMQSDNTRKHSRNMVCVCVCVCVYIYIYIYIYIPCMRHAVSILPLTWLKTWNACVISLRHELKAQATKTNLGLFQNGGRYTNSARDTVPVVCKRHKVQVLMVYSSRSVSII